jgi:type III restriction enzyme
LPVDQNGNRVMDPAINRLTLVVDESFKEFKDGLNAEYSESGLGGGSGPDVDNEDDFVEIQRRAARFSSPEFVELWKRIRYKAVYRIEVVDSMALTQAVAQAEYLKNLSDIQRRANTVQSADLIYDDTGKVVTSDESVAESAGGRPIVIRQVSPSTYPTYSGRHSQGDSREVPRGGAS